MDARGLVTHRDPCRALAERIRPSARPSCAVSLQPLHLDIDVILEIPVSGSGRYLGRMMLVAVRQPDNAGRIEARCSRFVLLVCTP